MTKAARITESSVKATGTYFRFVISCGDFLCEILAGLQADLIKAFGGIAE